MKERFQASKILRPIIALSLVGSSLVACSIKKSSEINKEQPSVVATEVPFKLTELAERLNAESLQSHFLVFEDNFGNLALYSEQGNGLREFGEFKQDNNGDWILSGYSLDKDGVVEVEIDTLTAVPEAQGLLNVNDPSSPDRNKPSTQLIAHPFIPVYP